MASPRVERILSEIAQLSDEEQGEILHDLPWVLRRPAGSSGLSAAAARQAIETRERIRRRLAAGGQSEGSIAADLDDVRELADPPELPHTPLPPGTPGHVVARLRVPPGVADAMERALEDCERIDEDE